jgi:hypothetical protein
VTGPAGVPSVAGIRNVLLGARDGGAADRAAAGELLRIVPSAVTAAYQNRRFLTSAVQFAALSSGLRQFIDLGCGFLATGAVHDTVLGIRPAAQVVYVDRDPAVVSQVSASLAGLPSVAAIRGDLRQPDLVLRDPAVLALTDIGEPVAIVLAAVLEYVADADDPGGIVAAFMAAVPPGSQLILSHAAAGPFTAGVAEGARAILRAANSPFVPRRREQVAGFFGGLDLVTPGVVSGATWRPGYQAADPRATTFFAGVGIKLGTAGGAQ